MLSLLKTLWRWYSTVRGLIGGIAVAQGRPRAPPSIPSAQSVSLARVIAESRWSGSEARSVFPPQKRLLQDRRAGRVDRAGEAGASCDNDNARLRARAVR
jgi:hypothetical protein